MVGGTTTRASLWRKQSSLILLSAAAVVAGGWFYTAPARAQIMNFPVRPTVQKPAPSPQDKKSPMLLQAIEIHYDYNNKRVSAVGNVQIYQNGTTIEADKVTYDETTKRMQAEGNVRITEPDGRITVLLDAYDGKPLNAPNDLVAHSDGSIWFTDPGWGVEGNYEGDKAVKELSCDVYRIDADTGEVEVVISEMARPNGICFSPDETLLYVVDVGQIRVFDIVAGRPANGRVFVATEGWGSDGIRCDSDGNVWAAAGNGGPAIDGVHCYHPDGTLLGQILLPETCAILRFGVVKNNCLFMTASRSLYSVYLEALGDQTP